MSKLMSDARQVLIIAGAVGLTVMIYASLQSCKGDDPEPEVENCTNGVDDDGDQIVDCEDIDCIFDPGCGPDGDGDADADPDGDADNDMDEPVDGSPPDGDGDSDTDVDVDADSDADESELCDPDAAICDWSCETDEDCVLVYDTLDCCGGFPHRIDDEMVACVTATHRNRPMADRCAIDWYFGDPVPVVPSGCTPACVGVSCPPCMPVDAAMRTVCRDNTCRALCSDCCLTDDDCEEEGAHCVDPTHEGQLRCMAGEHECEVGDECLTMEIYSDCTGCHCEDVDHDGFNDCLCYGCGSDGGPPPVCGADSDCPAHEFCIDRECTFMGEDRCREAMGDCGACAFCERDPEHPEGTRGFCVPIDFGDAGPPPDAGCE